MKFSLQSDASSETQASIWAAKLDGDSLPASERDALEIWLARKPLHRELLAQYRQLSTRLEQQLPVLVEAGALELPTPPPSPRWWQHRGFIAVAGLTAAAAAVAISLAVAPPRSQFQTIATAVTQRQTITLVDGTTVELNARSSLAVEITGNTRHVRLADGEAFFSVKKDPSRPFIVETPGGLVRVTGTHFDVQTESTPVLNVTVTEGSVQVRPRQADGLAAAPVSLAANDRLSSGPAGIATRSLSPRELDDTLAWRQGQVVFDGIPLSEAIARFARYHGRGINATKTAGMLRVGGRFSLDDFDGFFSSLEEILPVRVTRDSSGTVQIALRSEH